MIGYNELKKILKYNPETGFFSWLYRPRSMFSSDRIHKSWNTRFSEGIAGGFDGDGYIVMRLHGVRYRAHTLAWLYTYGEWPIEIDHDDHVRHHNWISNLNNGTRQDNLKNCSLRSDNTSGHVGVTWNKNRERWESQIMCERKKIFLGYFTEKKDAIKSRKKAEKTYGFHVNHGLPKVNSKGSL